MATVIREMASAAVSTAAAAGQKVVARFLNGTMLKGYNTGFNVNRQSFPLRTSADDSSAGVSVPLANLKAVFFVQDFAGNAAYRESKTFDGETAGRRVDVTFSDGELISGTTQGYHAGGVGFYVTPADPRANNARIFVVARAVQRVRFS